MRVIPIFIVFASLILYIGTLYNVYQLTSVSAACFFLAGFALLLVSNKNRGFFSISAVIVISMVILLISFLTIIENLSGMTFSMAVQFILIAFSFLVLLKKSISIWIVELLVWLVVLITFTSLFNYGHGLNPVSVYIKYTTSSVSSIVLFFLMSMGLLLINPDSGIVGILRKKNNTGYLLRRVIILPLILPILLFQIEIFMERRELIDSLSARIVTQLMFLVIIGVSILLAARILARKEAEIEESHSQLLHNELIFRQFAENIEIVFYTTSPDLSEIIYVSPAYEKIWGRSCDSLYKNPTDWYDSIIPEDKKIAYNAFFVGLQQGKRTLAADFRIKRPDGTLRNIFAKIYQVKDEFQHVFVVVGIAIDTTEIKLEKIYRQIQDDLLRLIEKEQSVTDFFHKTLEMIGCSLMFEFGDLWMIDEVKNRLHCVDTWHTGSSLLLHSFEKKSYQYTFNVGAGFPGRVWETKKPFFTPDYSVNPAYSRAGDAKAAGLNSALGVPIIYQDKIFGIMEFFSCNVSKPDNEMLTLMENIGKSIGEYIVHDNLISQGRNVLRHDFLTGLLNRITFEEDLDNELEDDKLKSIVVMVVDIDRFKLINDSFGHDFGDTLLKSVAKRLSEPMDHKKICLARLAADVFILYFYELDRVNAMEYAHLINRKFKEAFEIDDHKINISVGIGIATFPEDGLDSKSLVMNVNLALSQVKEKGGNRIIFFSKELPFVAAKTIAMQGELLQAMVSSNQFILEYQPQVDLKTGEICAAEVLVRWQHPSKGLMYPSKFISFAEKNNLIVSLNEHILRMVFQQLSLNKLEMPVSVNISSQQFEDGFHLVDYLELLTKEFAISPKQIELEITENMLLEDTEHNIAVLTAIHQLGFQIAIDDFGTGFSSFSYLNRLPVHKIKIDRAFITDLPVNLSSAKIVKAVIALVHSLDKTVVAEGAETKAEVEYLMKEKCDIVQGFYYYKPMSFDKLKAVMAKK